MANISQERARELRVWWMNHFDVYKTNVLYGIESESSEEKTAALDWYNRLLELPLEESAYYASNVPEKIRKYAINGKF